MPSLLQLIQGIVISMFQLVLALSFARPDILVADFEQPTYGDWITTGTAFGSGPAQGTLPNQMAVTSYHGHGLVNSYLGGDTAIGTLTSPTFTIQRKNISFLIGGGYHPGKTGINLLIEGKPVLSMTGRSKTPQDSEALHWANWDVAKWHGKLAKIEIIDQETSGWGHINVDDIMQSDDEKAEPKPQPEPLYKETYRPQFHFTAKKNWLNDPNGLVYANGEYHLFFQHNPGGIQWGDMHWGHAVSKDLFHWKELPIALSPTKLGTNFSGSAAIDMANTTGFGQNGKPPLVAMYTAAGKPFTQCLAYSNDKGRTWNEYANNPVLNHIAGENRDPRIFWHAPTHEWKMALYLDGDEFAILGSPNLKEWHELSRFHLPGSSECPELFEMPVGNSQTKTKWVFYAANCRYLVGSFDGKTFTPETEPRMLDCGQFYASQTYSDVPNGRRIQIGWMNGPGPFPNMPFNQQMGVPSDLTLDSHNVISRLPAKEIESLWHNSVSRTNETIPTANKQLANLKGGLYDIELAIQHEQISLLTIDIGGHELSIDPAAKKATFVGRSVSIEFPDKTLTVRILVDRSSVELFFNGGSVCLTSYLPVSNIMPKDRKITLRGAQQNFQIRWLRASEIKPTW